MINIDLSKAPSLRFFVYLLALFPGLFFLVSAALGNPILAEALIRKVGQLYATPPYVAISLALGSAFVIGQTFVFSSWIVELISTSIALLPQYLFRSLFASRWFYRWSGRFMGPNSQHPGLAQILSKLHLLAHGMASKDHQELQAVRSCLAAATEKLLERRYGIDRVRASGDWGVWYSVLGKPIKWLDEVRTVGRVALACGLAGFCALHVAPTLQNRYFVAMCAVFAFSGLWTTLYNLFFFRNPVRHDAFRLRSILLEIQDLPLAKPNDSDPEEIGT